MLIVSCSHCGHQTEDSFESLNSNTLHTMRCEACACSFTFFNIDCVCGEETPLSFHSEPSQAALNELVCQSCLRKSEASNDAQAH
jgi:hypothetical protein